MPRSNRVFLPGGIYHVYARVARGEPFFARDEEAGALFDVIRETKERDEFRVFAWALLSNHYHIAIQTGRVPLWRSMATIQGRSSKGFNRRNRTYGPLWQGRYRAKLVDDAGYLMRLIAYIHLNPVNAGLAADPARYRWCGHGDLLGRRRNPLTDADDALSVFGDERREARRAYTRTLRGEREQEWMGEGPGRLPWWRGTESEDDRISPSADHPFVDFLGRSTEPVPPQMSAADFLEMASDSAGVPLSELAGRGKASDIAEVRGLIVLLGVEEFRQKVNQLAEVLAKHPGSLSNAASRFARLRREDPEVRQRFDKVAARLRRRLGD